MMLRILASVSVMAQSLAPENVQVAFARKISIGHAANGRTELNMMLRILVSVSVMGLSLAPENVQLLMAVTADTEDV